MFQPAKFSVHQNQCITEQTFLTPWQMASYWCFIDSINKYKINFTKVRKTKLMSEAIIAAVFFTCFSWFYWQWFGIVCPVSLFPVYSLTRPSSLKMLTIYPAVKKERFSFFAYLTNMTHFFANNVWPFSLSSTHIFSIFAVAFNWPVWRQLIVDV